jgi:hypothetical protein
LHPGDGGSLALDALCFYPISRQPNLADRVDVRDPV